MSDDNKVSVEVGASTGPLEQGMRQGQEAVEQSTSGMRTALESVNGSVHSVNAGFEQMLAGVNGSAAGMNQALRQTADNAAQQAQRIAGAAGSVGQGMRGAANETAQHTQGLTGSVRQAAADVTQHGQRIGGALSGAVRDLNGQMGQLTGVVGMIQKRFVALAAITAGVGIFKEGIEQSTEFTKQAIQLSKALGISASEGATLNMALGDIYSSSDAMIGASAHLSRQLRNNESDLNKMGLVTRQANGEFRNMKDLVLDGAKVMGTYKEGTDRALAGQVLFGKGAAEVGTLTKLTNEALEDAAQKQRDLGMTVTKEGVEAYKEYKASMNDVGDVIDALMKNIGDVVMPIFTKLGQWFATIGPAAVMVTKGAIGGLAAAFWFLKNGVTIVWETINAMVVSVAEPIRALGSAIYKAMTGDWAGAKAEMAGIGKVVSAAWSGAMDEMAASSAETVEKVKNIFMEGEVTKATDTSKQKDFKDPSPKTEKKAKEPKDERMKAWEAQLLSDKAGYMLENEMREMSIGDEEAYWQKVLATLKAGDEQKSAVQKKIAEVNFASMKQQAAQRGALEQEVIDFTSKLAQGELDANKERSDAKLALGEITDAQALAQEEAYTQASYAIAMRAQQEKLQLLDKDPNRNLVERQKLLDQILLMEQKHSLDLQKINLKQTLEARKHYTNFTNAVASGFKQNIASLANLSTTFGGFMKGIFSTIKDALVDMAANWIVEWAKAAIMNRVIGATTGVAQVMTNAAVAGSAAFASIAAIPIVGPAMAPGAAAAAYAATAAFAPAASARGGFDIPAGVNPVTQLHEREMVLPQKQADAVRQMAEGGGGAGGITLNVSAMDGRSVERFFRDNGKHVVAALQVAHRNNAFKQG